MSKTITMIEPHPLRSGRCRANPWRGLTLYLTGLALAAGLAAGPVPVALATDEVKVDVPPENLILVQLGSESNQMSFFPGHIGMVQGERYVLVLTNPSPVTHEFASELFSALVVTEKLKIFDVQDNLVAYVVGPIVEVELLPGGRIEWTFVAARSAMEIDLFCDIPGHRDAGMVGSMEIRPQP